MDYNTFRGNLDRRIDAYSTLSTQLLDDLDMALFEIKKKLKDGTEGPVRNKHAIEAPGEDGKSMLENEIDKLTEKYISSSFKEDSQYREMYEEMIKDNIYSSYFLPPNLLVKNGMRFRTSCLLLWDSMYAEVFFSGKLFPDFTANDFTKAIESYIK